MSYNIDSIRVVAAEDFGIEEDVRDALAEAYADDMPEDSCLASGPLSWRAGDSFEWCEEGSGRSYDLLIEKILPRFHGGADLVVCFEGGDSYDGLRLRGGKVTRHEVTMALGAEKSAA